MSWIGRIALVLMPLALWACGGGDGGSSAAPEGPVMKQLQGEVFYRERILLPPGAELEVQLQDISRADAPAQVIASVTMPLEKSPPYAFSLQYDSASIDARMRYGISARIEVDGELRFINMEYIDPFGDGPLKVLVRAVPSAAAPQSESAEPEVALAGPTWELETLRGEAAPTGAQGRALTLEFDGEGRVGCFSGCNRFNGGIEQEGEAAEGSPLAFGLLASTMMACPEGMDVERAYQTALGEVDAYRISEGRLVLLAAGAELAVYRAASE